MTDTLYKRLAASTAAVRSPETETGHDVQEGASRKITGRRLLSFPDLKRVKGIPFTRQWIAELIKQGRFPKPVKPGFGAANSWFDHEVEAYLDDLKAQRDRGEAV